MMSWKLGDVLMYEDRRCKITKLTDTEAELTNLSRKDALDWSRVRILITMIKEDVL